MYDPCVCISPSRKGYHVLRSRDDSEVEDSHPKEWRRRRQLPAGRWRQEEQEEEEVVVVIVVETGSFI